MTISQKKIFGIFLILVATFCIWFSYSLNTINLVQAEEGDLGGESNTGSENTDTIWICCDPASLSYAGEGHPTGTESCDATRCTYTMVCCDYSANNFHQGLLTDSQRCDDTGNICTYDQDSTSDEDSVPDKYCADPAASNWEFGNEFMIPSFGPPVCQYNCQDPNARNVGDPEECRYEMVCTTPGSKNYVANVLLTQRAGGWCDTCPEHICCDQRANNCRLPPLPSGPGQCVTPYTTCNSQETCTYDSCDPSTEDCTGICQGRATCSVSSGYIAGTGEASFAIGGSCSSDDPEVIALAEAACISYVNVSLPLHSPQTAGIFTYQLNTLDYCANLAGDQHEIPSGYYRSEQNGDCVSDQTLCEQAGGTWINPPGACANPMPVCGSASGGLPVFNEPTTDLCNPGNDSLVANNGTTYTWTCSDPLDVTSVQCAVAICTPGSACEDFCTNISGNQDQQYLTINGLVQNSRGECYDPDLDLCSNFAGDQGPEDLVSLNVLRDTNGKCWDTDRGACGTAMNSLTWYNPPQTELCMSGSESTPVEITSDDSQYIWSCIDPDNNDTVVGECAVNKLCRTGERLCHGACIPEGDTCNEVSTTTLITEFKVAPKIVQKITDTCTLSWNAELELNEDSGCTVDGTALNSGNLHSSKPARPGSHTIYCHVGDQFQTKQVKCEVNPDFREI